MGRTSGATAKICKAQRTAAAVVVLAALLSLGACQPREAKVATLPPATSSSDATDSSGLYPSGARPITRAFGAHETDRPHLKGVDIEAPLGTPALAVDYAEVIRAGYTRDCGTMVRLRSVRTELGFFYCHLLSTNVKKGDHVRPGEVIGYIGASGHEAPSEQSRLRLVVWETGWGDIDPVSPERFLFGKADGKAACPEPEKVGKDPWEGGYGFGRAHYAREAGSAVLLYPVCDLSQYVAAGQGETVAKASPATPEKRPGALKLAPAVEALFNTYLNKPMPGVFAVSVDGRAASYNFCHVAIICAERRKVERHALERCRARSEGVPCRVYAWRGKVVWKDASR